MDGLQLVLGQIQEDLKFWLFAFLVLGSIRVLMLIIFRTWLGPDANTRQVIQCLLSGARFDARTATYWAAPCVLATVLVGLTGKAHLSDVLRTWTAAIFIIATVVLGAIAIGFFAEYKDHFNHWILGVVFDDMRAVVRTVWKDYPVVIPGALMFAAMAGLWWLWGWFERGWYSPDWLIGAAQYWWARSGLLAGLLLLLFIGLRGSLGSRPLQLKDAAVTKDRILNKLVLDPYSALRYAISQQLRLIRGKDLRAVWPDGDIRSAVCVVFGQAEQIDDPDQMIRRVSNGPPIRRARHVFLVVMESYDAWPVLDRYRPLQLSEGVRALAEDGVLVRAFVPAGYSTMTSIASIVTGLPDCGLVVNYHPSGRQPFPTSIAQIFRRLGYRTRMFYAGYLSWQRIGDFCAEQGFDQIHGGGHMDEPGLFRREWGVEDDRLFDYVIGQVNDDEPSFNLILSTGYHPPFILDVYAKGYPVRQIPDQLRGLCQKDLDLKMLGHLWFADRSLYQFVQRIEQRLTDTVFAITGDHWSRRFINNRPNMYESTAVLMLLRGLGLIRPGVPEDQIAGSHLDILPTLVELAAPTGFTYYAFGADLLYGGRQQVGFGGRMVITPHWMVGLAEPEKVLMLADMSQSNAGPQQAALLRRLQALQAIGWWRISKGPRISSSQDARICTYNKRRKRIDTACTRPGL
ncbi:MAG: LTA synthase family protein [Sedimentisphaerales bacterium]|nr:LTA synthase family protein [Sedimentisphaerales bacterium]